MHRAALTPLLFSKIPCNLLIFNLNTEFAAPWCMTACCPKPCGELRARGLENFATFGLMFDLKSVKYGQKSSTLFIQTFQKIASREQIYYTFLQQVQLKGYADRLRNFQDSPEHAAPHNHPLTNTLFGDFHTGEGCPPFPYL